MVRGRGRGSGVGGAGRWMLLQQDAGTGGSSVWKGFFFSLGFRLGCIHCQVVIYSSLIFSQV